MTCTAPKSTRWSRFWCFFGLHPVEDVISRVLALETVPLQPYEVERCPSCNALLYTDPLAVKYVGPY